MCARGHDSRPADLPAGIERAAWLRRDQDACVGSEPRRLVCSQSPSASPGQWPRPSSTPLLHRCPSILLSKILLSPGQCGEQCPRARSPDTRTLSTSPFTCVASPDLPPSQQHRAHHPLPADLAQGPKVVLTRHRSSPSFHPPPPPESLPRCSIAPPERPRSRGARAVLPPTRPRAQPHRSAAPRCTPATHDERRPPHTWPPN